MKFLKSIFNKADPPINNNSEFWTWFAFNEKKFFRLVKHSGPVNKDFLYPLSQKLNQLKDGYWFLVGMCNDKKAELIITADGIIKNIPFVEELINCAPDMPHWKVTALKQPTDIDNVCVTMENYTFDKNTIQFYSKSHKNMPDEIDITLTHEDYSELNKETIKSGVFLALDHYLGELNAVTNIDTVNIINPRDANAKLIDFSKLKSYLIWREKEFVEKYEGIRCNSDIFKYSGLEGKLSNGLPYIATINTGVLEWENKASHPWVVDIQLHYEGTVNNGLPDDSTYKLLDEIEDELDNQLKVEDGFINVGRETAENIRTIFLACIDFREPSKLIYGISESYKNKLKIDYHIYKDKYWQTFDKFRPEF